MTWSIGISGSTPVTLPLPPDTITDSNPAVLSSFPVAGLQSVPICEGLDLRTLTWEGSIYVAGQSNAYLETTYLAPLRALKGKLVVVTDPDSQFVGYWVLAGFDAKRVAEGGFARYTYTLKFVQGATALIL